MPANYLNSVIAAHKGGLPRTTSGSPVFHTPGRESEEPPRHPTATRRHRASPGRKGVRATMAQALLRWAADAAYAIAEWHDRHGVHGQLCPAAFTSGRTGVR